MEIINTLVDLFLHIDEHLSEIIRNYGGLTYLLLFAIIFMETGLVVTPFLPGDSLLFAAGAFAAKGDLNVLLLWLLLFVAAVIGDSVNYAIGHAVGPRAFEGRVRFLKREYLERTQAFYEKHGGKTIVLARFVPIVRTFAPFVAGVGTMNYSRFISYNILGGLLWTTLFIWLGYFFGNIPVVQENFEFVILAIVAISLVPMAVEFVRGQLRKPEATAA